MTIIVGLDLETTGLDQSAGHRIIEVAAVLHDLETTAFLGKYVQRINPQRPIDADAQRVHGITFDMLAAEPTWEQVAAKVHRILTAARYMGGHNVRGFDWPFLTGEFQRIGMSVPDLELIDTMEEGRWATPLGKLPNLGELCFATGVAYDPTQAHGAEYDITVNMQAYFTARAMGFFGPQIVQPLPAILESIAA
ncbi:MAG: 3'-5' exonuclease [Pseudomonadota bacterium]|nr:3'-5' exonuclease [Pseudomonadota bacterium]